MAMEITNVYTEQFPSLRFIGLCYTNADRDEAGGFGRQWGEWWSQNRFAQMQEAVSCAPFDDSTVGLMTMRGDGSGFTYWIGLFFPAGTAVPEGYGHLDLPESAIGVGWVCGKEENGEIYGSAHEAVCKKLAERGLDKFRSDVTGEDTYCFFERYVCPRFTKQDANGNVTLDYGNYIAL